MAIIEQIRFIFRRVKIMSTENRIFSSQQVFGSNNQGVKLNDKKRLKSVQEIQSSGTLGIYHTIFHLLYIYMVPCRMVNDMKTLRVTREKHKRKLNFLKMM